MTRKYGLINLGNTCYLNSVFQLFFNCTEFNDEIKNVRITPEEKQKLILSYRTIILTKDGNIPEGVKNFKITHFYEKYKKQFPWLGGRQQDADECIQLLFDTFHEEMKYGASKRKFNRYMTDCILSEYRGSARAELFNFCKDNYSPMNDFFFGATHTAITCQNCHHVCSKYEFFGNLQLSFGEEDTLDEIIENNYQPEKMEDYKCNECKKTNNIKKVNIIGLPKYLCITLKRFNFDTKRNQFLKNNKLIEFDDETTICNIKYKLNGIVNHSGAMNGGHYTSYNKYDDEWIQFDDEAFRPAKTINKRNAYILMYERV